MTDRKGLAIEALHRRVAALVDTAKVLDLLRDMVEMFAFQNKRMEFLETLVFELQTKRAATSG